MLEENVVVDSERQGRQMLEAEQMVKRFFHNLASDLVSVCQQGDCLTFLYQNNQKLYLKQTINLNFSSKNNLFQKDNNAKSHMNST